MANFNVDTSGNLWIGTGVSDNFSTAQSDSDTKFYVTSAGSIFAKSGTIGGIVIDANGVESSNFDSSTNTGWRLDNSTGIAQFFDIDINIDSSNNNTPSSTQFIGFGVGSIYGNSSSNDLVISAPQIAIQDSSGTPGATSPSLIFTDGTYSNPGFYAEENNADQRAEFYFSNGTHDIFHTRSGFNSIYFDATTIDIRNSVFRLYDSTGNNGEVLTKTSNGMEWTTTSGSHSDSDHTSFANSSHNHSEGDITNIGSHTHASNASWLNNDHGSHTSLGASGGNNGSSGNAARFDHSHSSSNVSVSAGSVTSNAGYLLRTLSASNNVITYNRSDFGSGLKMNSQRPTSNNSSSVGISTIEYSEMHARSGMFTFVYGANLGSSSEEIKTDISDLDLGLDFINDLTPKKYKYVSQVKEDDGKYTSDGEIDEKG